jgi:hypothetical protein
MENTSRHIAFYLHPSLSHTHTNGQVQQATLRYTTCTCKTQTTRNKFQNNIYNLALLYYRKEVTSWFQLYSGAIVPITSPYPTILDFDIHFNIILSPKPK